MEATSHFVISSTHEIAGQVQIRDLIILEQNYVLLFVGLFCKDPCPLLDASETSYPLRLSMRADTTNNSPNEHVALISGRRRVHIPSPNTVW